MKIMLRISFLLSLLLMLGGCASNQNQAPGRHFSLSYMASQNRAEQAQYSYLKVDMPNFSSKHNTEAIVYSSKTHQLDRYAHSEWKEPLPTLLQEWLLQSMERSNLFTGVMRGTSRAKVSMFLESDIIRFQHNLKQQSVEVSLRLTLLDYNSRKIIRHKIFNYQHAVSIPSAEGAVDSFNQILKKLDHDLFFWLSASS